MASALASPPPPLPFGASDLKRNARTFLERALVISAIVHLAAVGVFRATYERMIPKEEVEVLPPIWKHPFEIGPKIIPPVVRGGAPVNPTDGLFVPINRVDFTPQPFDNGDVRTATPGSDPVSDPGGSRTDGDLKASPPPEPPSAFTVAEIPPVPLIAPLPDYPDFAREARIEGKVMVEVLVGTDGLPKQVHAVAGPIALSGAAVEAVRRWRFRPGMTSGHPVAVKVVVPVIFTLE